MKKQDVWTQEKPNVYRIFSERLVLMMNIRCLRERELAEHLYVTRATISDYRTGRRFPNIEQLQLICIHLEVSADFMLGLSNKFHE